MEQIAKMEALSATFSPYLAEDDMVQVEQQIAQHTSSHRDLKAKLAEQAESLSTDIEEVRWSLP